jgi:hypothetical protein
MNTVVDKVSSLEDLQERALILMDLPAIPTVDPTLMISLLQVLLQVDMITCSCKY